MNDVWPGLPRRRWLVGAVRFVKKITDRGVLTLPTEIREALNVAEGDIVELEVLRVIKKIQAADRPSPAPSLPSALPSPTFPAEATP
jgi:AbrB family looped-hinge helix DNA binding protein